MKLHLSKRYLYLHFILFAYSFTGILAKYAVKTEFFSLSFFIFYLLILFILFVYAVVWQQILKNIPLTTAYANKSVTMVWGMIWGAILFQEKITVSMIIGALLIFLGIYLVIDNE